MIAYSKTVQCVLITGFLCCASACGPYHVEEVRLPFPEDYQKVSVKSEAFMSAAMELLSQVAGAGIRFAAGDEQEELWLQGAVVEHDKGFQTASIDFGSGGTWPGDIPRGGKFRISYAELRQVKGATFSIDLEDFYIHQVLINGSLSLRVLAQEAPNIRKYDVLLAEGKFTWPDGTYATRESNHHRVTVMGNLAMHNEFNWLGASSGLNRHGYAYTSIVTEQLTFRRTCLVVGELFPSSGRTESTMEGASFILDYGDGECNSVVKATINGEVSELLL